MTCMSLCTWHAVCWLAWASTRARAQSSFVTAQRTHASLDGEADRSFFDRYFGFDDGGSNNSCLIRSLSRTMPLGFGMHFPTSTTTYDRAGKYALEDWLHKMKAAHGNMSTYNGFLDIATTFYVPDLAMHRGQFEKDGVPFLERVYTAVDGALMYAIIVTTPGSGHVFELQSEQCAPCSATPFRANECAMGHRLPGQSHQYAALWGNSTTSLLGNRTVGAAGLPAPIVVQIKQAVLDIDGPSALWEDLFGPVYVFRQKQCTIATSYTGITQSNVGRKDIASWPDYPLQYVFVKNSFFDGELRPYFQWANELHEERLGFGWGFDRMLDFHVLVEEVVDTSLHAGNSEAQTMDAWAMKLVDHNVPFAAFGSDACDNNHTKASRPHLNGALYSAGIQGLLGIEFQALKFDHSFFDANRKFPRMQSKSCAPAQDCRNYRTKPACASASPESARALMAANTPTNSAYASLNCSTGKVVTGIAFASFGTPDGDCSKGFTRRLNCDVDVVGLAQSLCLGQMSCHLPASTTLYGQPCNSSTGWWIAVEAICGVQMAHSIAQIVI